MVGACRWSSSVRSAVRRPSRQQGSAWIHWIAGSGTPAQSQSPKNLAARFGCCGVPPPAIRDGAPISDGHSQQVRGLPEGSVAPQPVPARRCSIPATRPCRGLAAGAVLPVDGAPAPRVPTDRVSGRKSCHIPPALPPPQSDPPPVASPWIARGAPPPPNLLHAFAGNSQGLAGFAQFGHH